MGYFILSYQLDLAIFTLFLLGSMAWVHFRFHRSVGNVGIGYKGWLALGAIIAVGIVLSLGSGEAEKHRLENTISGLAPTYADEMARAGLAAINEKTVADDPTYLALINTQIRWQKANATIADIYTMAKRPDGKFILVVDSETDYNHNGVFDDEREKRTPIGEVYDEDNDLLEIALAGTPVFTPKPTTDRWGTWISTYVPVFDSAGKPFAILGVDFDAREYVRSILWHRGAMLSLAGLIGVILIGSLSLLSTLRSEMAKREVLSRQLIDASRRAGMADIAVGVLHNVGNVLNSVNVSASVIADKVNAPEVAELAEAAKMLHGHQADMAAYLTQDDAGKNVPAYVAVLADCVNNQHHELNQEIIQLTRGIEHIKEIVRSQQQFAKSESVVHEVNPADVVDEAITFNFPSSDHSGIKIERVIEAPNSILIDKHKVLQVLINLIANARQALLDSTASPRRLTVSVRSGNAIGFLLWEVKDNGIGIAPQLLASIFQNGFTTKPDGHGFGLHSSANAATEMGGTLKVHSDGPGNGAAFTLEIPTSTLAEVQS